MRERPRLKCEDAHLVEIVKLRHGKRLVNVNERECYKADLFWLDEAAHEFSTLQMFPRTHTHSMQIHFANAL